MKTVFFLILLISTAPLTALETKDLFIQPWKVPTADKEALTNNYLFKAESWFKEPLVAAGFNLLTTNIAVPVTVKGRIYAHSDLCYLHIWIYTASNNTLLHEDETFSPLPLSEAGLSNAASALAARFINWSTGIKDPVYQLESAESEFATNEEGFYLIENTETEKLSRIQLLSLGSLTYTYPLGLEIGAIEIFNIWFQPDWKLGIGIGSKLARLYLNMPGYTSATGTILPLQIFVPVWINPENEKHNDLIVETEWAWYAPIQVSGTAANTATTNTNINYFLDRPVNYIKLSASYYFTPFTYLQAGVNYFYNTGSFSFFIGGSFLVGFYKKE